MQQFKSLALSRLTVFIACLVLALSVAWPLMGTAQGKSDKAKVPDAQAQHKDKQPPGDQNLASQLAELRVKVTALEAALVTSQASGMNGMAGGGQFGQFGQGGGQFGQGGGAFGQFGQGGGMEDMDMMEMIGMMGMAPKSAAGMGGMKSMGKMQLQAALPGFPGASHIYHVGATDLFLNHPQHIKLTTKQTADLVRLQKKAILAKTTAQRKIDEAEQELWTLTSADEPDLAKIAAKIQEIEQLRGDQRLALIRAVGDAAKLLTDEQRQAVLGTNAAKTAEGKKGTP